MMHITLNLHLDSCLQATLPG